MGTYTQFVSNLASDQPVEYHLYNLGCISNITWVYTDLLQLVVQPIRRHFENRKGPDSRLPEKRYFADFRNIANAIKGKRFHENGNIGYKFILLIKIMSELFFLPMFSCHTKTHTPASLLGTNTSVMIVMLSSAEIHKCVNTW